LILSLVQFGATAKRLFEPGPAHPSPWSDRPPDQMRHVYGSALYYVGWLLGLYGAIWVVGFVIAMTLFVFAFLRWEAERGWARYWPEGQLGLLLELPWPLT